MALAGRRHGAIIINLKAVLAPYCKNPRDWICFATDTAYTMAYANWRCPDAALVRVERFPGRKVSDSAGDFPPDVEFEVYSPGDTASRVASKRKDYLNNGVIQVWIDPEARSAELIEPDRPVQHFDESQPLVIGKLQGFALNLHALFEV